MVEKTDFRRYKLLGLFLISKIEHSGCYVLQEKIFVIIISRNIRGGRNLDFLFVFNYVLFVSGFVAHTYKSQKLPILICHIFPNNSIIENELFFS